MAVYGLTGRLAALALERAETETVGRVIAQDRGSYRVVSATGERMAEVSGRLRYETEEAADFPAVGDFVRLREEDSLAVIQGILPRRSAFVRRAAGTGCTEQVVAANIDTAFICMALNGDFNLRRLERYLAVAWDSGAVPVVVLTKADLCENMAQRLSEVACVAAGAEVVTVSAVQTDGLRALAPYLRPGKTVALLGSSGVGKSTLINRLLGEERLRTNGLRDDDRGRHTTTRRELFLLAQGGMVIDTPGMRELGDCGTRTRAWSSPLPTLRCWQPGAASGTAPIPVSRAAPSGRLYGRARCLPSGCNPIRSSARRACMPRTRSAIWRKRRKSSSALRRSTAARRECEEKKR